jgi:hypothetical protein
VSHLTYGPSLYKRGFSGFATLCADTVGGMGFLTWLRSVTSEPEYLRAMTPEERAERRRQDANRNMFAVQMFDMPKPPAKHDGEPPAKS